MPFQQSASLRFNSVFTAMLSNPEKFQRGSKIRIRVRINVDREETYVEGRLELQSECE